MRYSIDLKPRYKVGDRLLNKTNDLIYIIKEVHPGISLSWVGSINSVDDFKELLEDILIDLNDEDHPNYNFTDIAKDHNTYVLINDPSWIKYDMRGSIMNETRLEFSEFQLNEVFQVIYEDEDTLQ